MKPLVKHKRALKVLKLMGQGKSVQEIADILGRPVSTIYKHLVAFKTLTGKDGEARQELAYDTLFFVRLGLSQREVARTRSRSIDHKFISDLCAMDWAIRRLLNQLDMSAVGAMVERGIASEVRDRQSVRDHIPILSEAFDELLVNLPKKLSPELQAAITDLTEAIIEVESIVK